MIQIIYGKPNVIIGGKPVRIIDDHWGGFDHYWHHKWHDKCERMMTKLDVAHEGHVTYVRTSNLVELLWKLKVLR